MSTLVVVEEVLKEHRSPMVVREIVVAAGDRLPTRSRTPDTVVARDLAMNIKLEGDASRFARVAPGKYTLRAYAHEFIAVGTNTAILAVPPAHESVVPTTAEPPVAAAMAACASAAVLVPLRA